MLAFLGGDFTIGKLDKGFCRIVERFLEKSREAFLISDRGFSLGEKIKKYHWCFRCFPQVSLLSVEGVINFFRKCFKIYLALFVTNSV